MTRWLVACVWRALVPLSRRMRWERRLSCAPEGSDTYLCCPRVMMQLGMQGLLLKTIELLWLKSRLLYALWLKWGFFRVGTLFTCRELSWKACYPGGFLTATAYLWKTGWLCWAVESGNRLEIRKTKWMYISPAPHLHPMCLSVYFGFDVGSSELGLYVSAWKVKVYCAYCQN